MRKEIVGVSALFTSDEKIAVGDCSIAIESLKSTPDGE